ncbi:iron ABC transporter permease [Frankia sp. CNm7]|uniref:Iron ABC transporter permease n=1 Tax=Frankia nepalensis TaxID=1836974 RepID=A0A937RJJ3_9ACTN|nr:iron ABC transporter permease [Frankia nepalensis]MBL7501539.1 iron ABC transporter permease [Frankia nepalensis]MBL7513029.1 iron ABC transporter permease [Frankia nepalensis]MBL7518368.1 iron ABC transporter permease [Frankia nepalensis]MBL7630019.1 iron ABC transporter permease [Frankia nepalensis]
MTAAQTIPPASAAATTTTATPAHPVGRLGGRTTFRLRRPPVSGVLRGRLVAVCAALAALTFAALCGDVMIGDFGLGVGEVLGGIFGTGSPDAVFIVQDLRLPRVLVGLLVGIAFGIGGALLQTITRNPLASPDTIGITAGGTTAVVAGIVLGLESPAGALGLSLAGAVATALAIYLLAWKGGTTGYRIVLVGVAVSWICASLTQFLLARANVYQAQEAVGWLVGNINGRGWENVVPLAVAMAVLVPPVLALHRWAQALQLGDDLARGIGVPVHAARLVLLLAGVCLVAFAAAAAGPVAFVSLAAPQIAQRLAGLAWPPLVASALTGALMVLASDVVARTIVPDTELPVGVVTGVLGAPFLFWLLTRANRIGTGG